MSNIVQYEASLCKEIRVLIILYYNVIFQNQSNECFSAVFCGNVSILHVFSVTGSMFHVCLFHFMLDLVSLSSAIFQTAKHLAAAVTSHMLIHYNVRESFGLGQ